MTQLYLPLAAISHLKYNYEKLYPITIQMIFSQSLLKSKFGFVTYFEFLKTINITDCSMQPALTQECFNTKPRDLFRSYIQSRWKNWISRRTFRSCPQVCYTIYSESSIIVFCDWKFDLSNGAILFFISVMLFGS